MVLEGLDIQHGLGVTAMAEETLGEPVAATSSGEHLSVGPRNSCGWWQERLMGAVAQRAEHLRATWLWNMGKELQRLLGRLSQ